MSQQLEYVEEDELLEGMVELLDLNGYTRDDGNLAILRFLEGSHMPLDKPGKEYLHNSLADMLGVSRYCADYSQELHFYVDEETANHQVYVYNGKLYGDDLRWKEWLS